jgi:hypothetical protein
MTMYLLHFHNGIWFICVLDGRCILNFSIISRLTCCAFVFATMQAFATVVGLCFAIAALLFFGLTILWA